MTGVFRTPLVAMLDRELVCQTGQGIRAWAEAHGMTLAAVVDALHGREPNSNRLFYELATTLGISTDTLRSLCQNEKFAA